MKNYQFQIPDVSPQKLDVLPKRTEILSNEQGVKKLLNLLEINCRLNMNNWIVFCHLNRIILFKSYFAQVLAENRLNASRSKIDYQK